MSKRVGGIIGCKDKTSSTGSPMVVTLGQQYNIGEKPTVILLYTNINHHAGTPNKRKTMKYIIKQGSSNILFHRLQRYNLYMTFKRVPRW